MREPREIGGDGVLLKYPSAPEGRLILSGDNGAAEAPRDEARDTTAPSSPAVGTPASLRRRRDKDGTSPEAGDGRTSPAHIASGGPGASEGERAPARAEPSSGATHHANPTQHWRRLSRTTSLSRIASDAFSHSAGQVTEDEGDAPRGAGLALKAMEEANREDDSLQI